jgi:hypothetical protein
MTEKLGLENINKPEKIDRDRRTTVISRFLYSAENIESLHGRKVEDIFLNEEGKRTFIDGLQTEGFEELLNGVNGILRGKKKSEWNMDGEGVAVESSIMGAEYVPPRQEDKVELLAKALIAAKKMNGERRELKDIALLVSASLNAVHPYADGNGRTSRFIYLLLTENFNDVTKDKLQQILGENGRDSLNISPGVVQWDIRNLLEKELGLNDQKVNSEKITNLFFKRKQDARFNEAVPAENQSLFNELLNKDTRYLFLSVFKYLKGQEDKDKYLRKFPDRAAVPVDLLSKNLTPEGLSEIIQNYRGLKKEYIEKLIDSIAYPEKDEYQFEYNGQRISLKDYFELRIKEEAERVAEEDRLSEERSRRS